MKKNPSDPNDESELRRQADVRLGRPAPEDSPSDTRRMLQELQIFRIELELQNEELKHAKEKSESALERYTDLYEFAPAGYFSLDDDGVILEANLAGAALLGTERGRLPARRFEVFVDPAGRHDFKTFLARVFAGHQKQTREMALLDFQSTASWSEVQAQAAVTAAGERRWCRVAVIDATARRRSEAALRANEARFRAYVTAGADAIYRMSPDWSAMEELVGRNFLADTPEVSRAWLEIYIHRDDQPRVLAAIGEAIRARGVFALEHRVRRADGTIGWSASRAVPVLDEAGEITEWLGVASDVTQRKLAEEALSASNERLRVLFNSIDKGFCIAEVIFDAEGRACDHLILEVNPAFEKLTGLKNPAGQRASAFVPEFQREWSVHFGRVAQTGIAERLELASPALERWFDVFVSRVGGENSRKVAVVFTNTTVRRAAQEALRQSEQQLSLITKSVPVAVLHLDADQRVRFANPAYLKLRGKLTGEIVGKTMGAIMGRSNYAKIAAYLDRAYAGEPQNYENRVNYPEIGVRDIKVQYEPVRDSAGQVQGVVSVIEDITERKRADEALRISEVRYRRLFEAAKDGVLLLDPVSGEITDANPFMTELLGFTRDELLGQQLFQIGLLKDAGASREMVRKLKRNQQVRYEDLSLVNRNGGRQDVEVVANLYRENGHAVIQCNVRDITQRKRAMAVLSRSEALFSALIAEAPFGVYVVDGDFRFQQVNRVGQAVFKNISPLIGRDVAEIFRLLWSKPVAANVTRIFRHTLATGEFYQTPRFNERRRDLGKVEVYDWRIQRVTLPNGEHRGVCFFNNITARVRAESAQRRLVAVTASNQKLKKEIVRRQAGEKALKQSERRALGLLKESRLLQKRLREVSYQSVTEQEDLRKEISRELHDEISQLLVGINVRLAIFARAVVIDPDNVRRTLAPLRRMVDKSMRTVYRFSRELRPSSLDDLGLLPALRSYIDELPKRRSRRIKLEAYAGVEAFTGQKRTVLYRVALEALTNIGRHARASAVNVVIRPIRGGACLEIIDNGKAFDVARATSIRSGRRLGLTGMRERVEMVGGRFTITSVAGVGTTVRVEMPLRRSKLRALARSSTPAV